MTSERQLTKYLTKDSVRIIYNTLFRFSQNQGEPIPPFEESCLHMNLMESVLDSVQQKFFGEEVYSTIEEKSAFLFYSFVKNHVFVNGNKRMATLCLEIFLAVNNKKLDVGADVLLDKVIEVATSPADAFIQVKNDLIAWFGEHIK